MHYIEWNKEIYQTPKAWEQVSSNTKLTTGRPGYRIYFGNDGEKLIVLLGGGTKKRQGKDIDDAKARWKEYKKRKKLNK